MKIQIPNAKPNACPVYSLYELTNGEIKVMEGE